MIANSPSEAWLDEVFNSPPRTSAFMVAKSTTRHPMLQDGQHLVYANGAHERTAMYLLEHLRVCGYARRWKTQPLFLSEIGGPKSLPDLMVQLQDGAVYVIEVKSHRFLSPEVLARFDGERQLLAAMGMRFRVWTNKDVLSSSGSHTLAALDRGRRFPAHPDVLEQIGASAREAEVLGELLDMYPWDDVVAAAAALQFHINALEPLHEKSPIHRTHSDALYRHCFEERDAHARRGFWAGLSPNPE